MGHYNYTNIFNIWFISILLNTRAWLHCYLLLSFRQKSIVMLVFQWIFGLVVGLSVSAFATIGHQSLSKGKPLDRYAQRDVMDQLRGVPKVIEIGEKSSEKAAKMYLTKLRDKFANVLDRPWDTKYTNHRNMKKWVVW